MRAGQAFRVGVRSLYNRLRGWPICVSFEVTHSCVANCKHCDKGGIKDEQNLMLPVDYARYSRMLKPGVCQISGGEPLVRDDLEEIIKAVKRPSGLPLVVCVTNSWLLNEKRYLALKNAGVSLFSISLDFPDERHDDFRQVEGLFEKMQELLPYLARKYAQDDIVLNCALTRANFAEIPALVTKAKEWGVPISFSAYSELRTGDRSLCITDASDLALLRKHIDYLKNERRRSRVVINSDYILEETYRFFADGGQPNCKAGIRFIVVRPDGEFNACSMFPELRFKSRLEAVRVFAPVRKQCDKCYVSIRASTERPLRHLILDNIHVVTDLLKVSPS